MINKLLNLYKNKYVKLLVFVLFLFFLYNSHEGLNYIREPEDNSEKNQKINIVKKIKTVLSETKNGHASYTKEVTYEYEGEENEKSKPKKNLSVELNKKITKEIALAKKEKELVEKREMEQKRREMEIEKFIEDYEITENKETENNQNSIKCGDSVKYKMATYMDGKPISLQTLQLMTIIGIDQNKKLENKFIGKQKNDVFEIDLETFLGKSLQEFQKEQQEILKQNGYSYPNNTNYNNSMHNINLKYRIKITEITKSDKETINKYCKK